MTDALDDAASALDELIEAGTALAKTLDEAGVTPLVDPPMPTPEDATATTVDEAQPVHTLTTAIETGLGQIPVTLKWADYEGTPHREDFPTAPLAIAFAFTKGLTAYTVFPNRSE